MQPSGSIYLSNDFFKAIENFVKAEGKWTKSPLYKADVASLTALYLGGKTEWLTRAINWQYEMGDTAKAAQLEKDFEYLLGGMDRLLSTHPTLRLERWIDFAHGQAANPEQLSQYERNARRIVTIWGPPVDDYSARVWSGLLRDYYLPRWKHYFSARKSGIPFDFAKWEAEWVSSSGLSKAHPSKNVVKEARKLIAHASYITPELFPQSRPGQLGTWMLKQGERQKFVYKLSAENLGKIKGIWLQKGEGEVVVRSLFIVADGNTVYSLDIPKDLCKTQNRLLIPVNIAEDVRANNGVEMTVEIENLSGAGISGDVSSQTM